FAAKHVQIELRHRPRNEIHDSSRVRLSRPQLFNAQHVMQIAATIMDERHLLAVNLTLDAARTSALKQAGKGINDPVCHLSPPHAAVRTARYSSSVIVCLALLWCAHAVATLSRVWSPPRDRGTRCSRTA